MPSQSDLREVLRRYAGDVDRALSVYIDERSDPARHYEMVRHHFGIDAVGGPRAPTGKRMRAVLALLVGRALGGPERALSSLAAACELIHASSLVHDDIQDGDRIRWERPTVWVKYGTAQAINVGDALLGMSFQALSAIHEGGAALEAAATVFKIFSDGFVRMAEGQHLDMSSERNLGIEVSAYLDIIERKTGAACETPTHAAAVISTSNEQTREAYRRFGRDLGVLYQICDDYAGIWGSVGTTGKAIMNDVALRKASLPLILGHNRGSASLRYLLSTDQPPQERRRGPTAGQKSPDFVGAEARAIREELTRIGVDQQVREYAARYRESALTALSEVPPAAENEILRLVVASVYGGIAEAT